MVDPSPPPPARRGARLYFASALLAQACGLLRYVVLARLLGPAELGLAAALTVTGSFFELISDTGSDRFLIQDREGDAPAVQRLVQLVYAGRGVAVAAALAVGAAPIAWLYGTPRLAGGLVLLALSPLIGGLLHLDTRRLQRQHDFRLEALCSLSADLAGLAGAVAAAWLLRSYIAVAVGFIARSAVLVLVSHVLARRRYALGYAAAHAPRLARFAAPLMLNGLTLFLVLQGDRVVVGNRLGVVALGYYTAVLLLIYYPSAVIANTLHALFVPRIAGERDHAVRRDQESDLFGAITLLLATGMAAGFVLVAPMAVPLLYGRRFAQSAVLIGLIGLLQGARFLLSWPTTVALAMGRSLTVLLANLSHFAIIPGAAIGLWLIGGLPGIVTGLLGAELGAVVVALLLMNRATGRPTLTGFGALAMLMGIGAAILGYGAALDAGRWMVALGGVAVMAALLGWQVWRDRGALSLLREVYWQRE